MSTAEFQSGAIEYARVHGIALIHMVRGREAVIQKSLTPAPFPDWAPKVVGFMHTVG